MDLPGLRAVARWLRLSAEPGSVETAWLSKQAPIWLALVATAFGLVAGFLLKWPCTSHPWDGFQYRRLCYNDIQPLFHVRGISRGVVPYSGDHVGTDLQVEYPVLTGMFMDVTGRVLRGLERLGLAQNSDPDYFVVSAVLLAPFAFVVTLKLRRSVTAGRLLLWAIGPPLVLYAFHNWDLLAVAGAVWGLVEAERRRPWSAGAGFGIGASAKLYPVFIVPGAVLSAWAQEDRSRAVRLTIAFGLSAVILNVPWMIRSLSGWLAVWSFHSRRYPDFGTVWHWIGHHGSRLFPGWSPGATGYRDFVSIASLILFAGGATVFLVNAWRRRSEAGSIPAATGLGILCVFLLVSKVHSPQYALWIVPFLVMLNVPRSILFSYLAADLTVYVSGFYWFTVFDAPAPGWKGIFEFAVLARAAAIGALAWWATKARRFQLS
jgi:uncharacterized membrane protein